MVGSLYSLVGVGIVVIYKSTHVFNFAQGGLLMVGAYLAWCFMEQVGMPIWLGSDLRYLLLLSSLVLLSNASA